MRAIFLVSISSFILSGCLTTQENPNYEHSTAYRTSPVATQQYASVPATQAATYTQAPIYTEDTAAAGVTTVNHVSTIATQAAPATYPIYAHRAPTRSVIVETAPTDIAYSATEVTGTPGFMAIQGQSRSIAVAEAAPALPAAQAVISAPIVAAGTPIAYDYSRNLVMADALTTGQQPAETVRVLGSLGQTYTVQPGDTVYSLSRRTCVGVNVIQSMNGLDANYGIQIGQSLTLPASVC